MNNAPIAKTSEFRRFLRVGERAIDRGESMTHDQLVIEIGRWKRSRKSAR